MSTKYRVLIVEDDPMTLSLLSQMVNAFGEYEIVSCRSAKEAIEKLISWQPDVILSDFMMDNGDGIDLLNNVRGDYGKEIPFVFITCVNINAFSPLISNEVNINILPKPLKIGSLREMFNKLELIDSAESYIAQKAA